MEITSSLRAKADSVLQSILTLRQSLGMPQSIPFPQAVSQMRLLMAQYSSLVTELARANGGEVLKQFVPAPKGPSAYGNNLEPVRMLPILFATKPLLEMDEIDAALLDALNRSTMMGAVPKQQVDKYNSLVNEAVTVAAKEHKAVVDQVAREKAREAAAQFAAAPPPAGRGGGQQQQQLEVPSDLKKMLDAMNNGGEGLIYRPQAQPSVSLHQQHQHFLQVQQQQALMAQQQQQQQQQQPVRSTSPQSRVAQGGFASTAAPSSTAGQIGMAMPAAQQQQLQQPQQQQFIQQAQAPPPPATTTARGRGSKSKKAQAAAMAASAASAQPTTVAPPMPTSTMPPVAMPMMIDQHHQLQQQPQQILQQPQYQQQMPTQQQQFMMQQQQQQQQLQQQQHAYTQPKIMVPTMLPAQTVAGSMPINTPQFSLPGRSISPALQMPPRSISPSHHMTRPPLPKQ